MSIVSVFISIRKEWGGLTDLWPYVNIHLNKGDEEETETRWAPTNKTKHALIILLRLEWGGNPNSIPFCIIILFYYYDYLLQPHV